MSRNNDGCGGCLAQLLVFGLLIGGGILVDFYQNSQYGMINKARENNYSSHYFRYLEKYPNGRYAAEAKDSIYAISSRYTNVWDVYHDIAKAANDPICDQLADIAYNHTLSLNTLDAWREYINRVPYHCQRDAQVKIDSLETVNARQEAKMWGTEQLAWKTANEIGTYESYQKYIQLYPNGAHKSKANKMLIDYEVARDFSGKHGTMPAMEKTSYGSGTFSTVTVTNQTAYVMTLLYSGEKESERLVIYGGDTKSVRLPNGNYRISARVNASNVIPYVGSETLSGGDYSASYYISTSRY